MEINGEEWRDVRGYIGIYQVSNLGNVRSLTRTIKRRNNTPKRMKGVVLKFGYNEFGYRVVSLCHNARCKTYKVHRLVAFAFIKKIKGKTHVNHINLIKTDNRTVNLEWCTQGENVRHTYKHGKINHAKGDRSGRSKLVESEVISLRLEYESGNTTQKELGVKYGVDSSVICRIVNKESWKHVQVPPPDSKKKD